MTSQFADIMSLSFFFLFDVNVLLVPILGMELWLVRNGSGVMTICLYKKLNGNAEIRNTPVEVLLNILSLGQVRDIKFGTNVSNKKLLNTTKCRRNTFYRF